jgi:PKD repeat protein
MEKDKLLMFIVMLVTICISVFSLSRSYEAEHVATSVEEKVTAAPLSVEVFADETSGAAPHNVTFSSLVLNAKDDVKYNWDFGDGQTSDEAMPTHTYADAGSYVCTLTATDSQKEVTKQIDIKVVTNQPPIIAIMVDKQTGNRPITINFEASVFDVDSEVFSYAWVVTDPPLFGIQKSKDYKEKNFSRTFIRPGWYEIKLTVTDDAENSVTQYMKLQILKSKPELFFDQITGLINTGLYYYGQIQNLRDLLGKILNPNHAPNMPSDPSPSDVATGVDVNSDLSWTCTDPDKGDTLTYDIYFGTTSPPPLVISGHNTTSFALGLLQSGITYYWKIVAKDPDGLTTTGPIWSFTTV